MKCLPPAGAPSFGFSPLPRGRARRSLAALAWSLAVTGLLSLSSSLPAKAPPAASLVPEFPSQGAEASRPTTFKLRLESPEALTGSLAFETTRFEASGGVPSRAVSFKAPRISTGETREIEVTVAQEGVYEIVATFRSGEKGAAVVIMIVSEKGKLWFGRDNLMNVAAARLAAQSAGAPAIKNARPAEGASARIEELQRQMAELYQK